MYLTQRNVFLFATPAAPHCMLVRSIRHSSSIMVLMSYQAHW